MGNFASRIHSKEDGKVYNILPLGDMPTVVFGRVIKPNSVPGMQYYFPDGRVKWKDGDGGTGYSYVKPFPKDGEEKHWGDPCIFTVPENLDFNKMSDVNYVKQFCKTAVNLNANTMSPNYIIRNGKLICIKTINEPGSGVVVAKHKYKVSGGYRNFKITHGKRLHGIHNISNIGGKNCKNKFTIIPVGRVKYKRQCGDISFYRYKQSIYHYNIRKIVKWNNKGDQIEWKYKLL